MCSVPSLHGEFYAQSRFDISEQCYACEINSPCSANPLFYSPLLYHYLTLNLYAILLGGTKIFILFAYKQDQ